MNEFYRISFLTSDGDTKILKVNDADTSLLPSAVSAAAQDIVTSNIFKLDGGASLASIKKVELYGVTKTVLI